MTDLYVKCLADVGKADVVILKVHKVGMAVISET